MMCITLTADEVTYFITYQVANNNSHGHSSELHKYQLNSSSGGNKLVIDLFSNFFSFQMTTASYHCVYNVFYVVEDKSTLPDNLLVFVNCIMLTQEMTALNILPTRLGPVLGGR